MNILHYIATYAPAWSFGGPPRSVANLCEGLVALGHVVRVLTTNAGLAGDCSIRTDRWVERNGVQVRYFPAKRDSRVVFSAELEAAISEEVARCDVLHITGVWQPSSIAAYRAAWRARKPYVCSPRGALGRYSFTQKAWKKWPYFWFCERPGLRHAAALHYTSQMEIEECGRLRLRPQAFAVPNSIDFDLWERDPGGAAAWRTSLGISADECVFLYAGRLHHKKGLDLLPGVCAALPRDRRWRLVLVGNDEDGTGELLRWEFAAHGIEERLIVCDAVNSRQLATAYSAAQCFVMPSRHENFGNVAVEALACGCPVMLSDQVGAWQELQDLDAVTVLPLRREFWVAAMTRALEARGVCPQTRAQLEARFSQNAVARAMAAAYAKVAP
jgi:glycosyltransferase involved in cell wall biosynthesis